MKTKVIKVDEQKIESQILNEPGEAIRNGKLVVFPTETVYGLGADALNPEAIKNIFIVKGRPQDNPLIVHIADFEQINELVSEVPDIAQDIINEFWPGPLTIIMKKSNRIPSVTCAGLDTVGIRMPSNNVARELIRKAGTPIAAPSANLSGKPSPTELERCIEDLDNKVEYIIGGRKSDVGVESTIIDCSVYPPCILRPGGITLEMLQKIDRKIYIDPAIISKSEDNNFKPKAPGMKYRHYAPKAPVKIIQGEIEKTIAKISEMVQNYIDENKIVGIMATEETKNRYENGIVISLGTRKDMRTIAQNLFEVLRSFDDKEVDIILSESFDENGIGVAIMNRLKKSAGFNIIKA